MAKDRGSNRLGALDALCGVSGDIVVENRDDAWLLRLRGDHDLVTANALDAELETLLELGATVIVDLSETTFMDSTVLSRLIRGARITEETTALAIISPPESHSRRMLRIVALDRQLPVYDCEDAALAALQQANC